MSRKGEFSSEQKVFSLKPFKTGFMPIKPFILKHWRIFGREPSSAYTLEKLGLVCFSLRD